MKKRELKLPKDYVIDLSWLPEEEIKKKKKYNNNWHCSKCRDLELDGDGYGEDDGEFDRILQQDYEENKEFYEELARKYGNV